MAVSSNQYRLKFIDSETAFEIKEQLRVMEDDPKYHTKSSYSPTCEGSDISFVDKHFAYISTHPAVNPQMYVANLRLMTKVRV